MRYLIIITSSFLLSFFIGHLFSSCVSTNKINNKPTDKVVKNEQSKVVMASICEDNEFQFSSFVLERNGKIFSSQLSKNGKHKRLAYEIENTTIYIHLLDISDKKFIKQYSNMKVENAGYCIDKSGILRQVFIEVLYNRI